MDRRDAIKWMLAAGAGAMLAKAPSLLATDAPKPGAGYGTDPDLMTPAKPGQYWPLTFTDAQRRLVAALSDIVIPAEGSWPSASAVGVTDFMDEWVSAPYPVNLADAAIVLPGIAWVEDESKRRFSASFADATAEQRLSLVNDMAVEAPKGSPMEKASAFFKKFRNLTASGYYTTPIGMKDLGYVGNVPLAKFEGPPADLVAKLGLTDEVTW
jgi:hypothetical protein